MNITPAKNGKPQVVKLDAAEKGRLRETAYTVRALALNAHDETAKEIFEKLDGLAAKYAPEGK